MMCAVAGVSAQENPEGVEVATSDNTLIAPTIGEEFPQISRWRFAVDAGYSYLTADIAEGAKGDSHDFLTKLRHGINYGGDIHYFPFPGNMLGVGMKFVGREYSTAMGQLSETVRINYIGPSAIYRMFDMRDRNAWIFSFSAGSFRMNDRLDDGGKPYEYLKAGFGTCMDMGYDIRLGKSKTFLGLKFSFAGAKFKIKTSDYFGADVENTERNQNFSAAQLGAGLRF